MKRGNKLIPVTPFCGHGYQRGDTAGEGREGGRADKPGSHMKDVNS